MALFGYIQRRCLLLLSVACAILLIAPGFAEPVQYCRFGHDDSKADFCAGITMHHNHSSGTDAHDLYLSISVTRSSALGWTAVGTGPMMAGSLMFIIYGDPTSGEAPIMSIRTVDGHHQPRLLTKEDDLGGADLRVLQADWMPGTIHDDATTATARPEIFTARFAIVCYACTLFPGSQLAATSVSQPWIWAWNARQELPVYAFDAQLDMHAHHAGNGGWGVFYVDMARSISEAERRPSFPPLRPRVSRLGTVDEPIGAAGVWEALKAKPTAGGHGLAMVLAFLGFFPTGTAVMRSGSAKAFKWHWVIQLIGCGFTIVGVVAGLVMSGGRVLATTHQRIGITIAVLLLLQSVLGWRHHVVFIRIRRRTWMSHAHIWLGRVGALALGWANVLTGLLLSGHDQLSVGLTAGLICIEAVGLCTWIWRAKRQQPKQQQTETTETLPWQANGENYYFAVDGSDEESEGDADVSKGNLNERKEKDVADN